jgi:cephalosporin hydroxylase
MTKRLILPIFSLLLFLSSLIIFFILPREKPLTKEQVVEKFIQVYHTANIHNMTTWMRIPAQQSPCDLWAIQEIIWEIKPDFIVETGTFKGGGTLFMASVLQNISPSGKVITVDIESQIVPASKLALFQERVEFIEGDSVADETIRRIAERVRGSKVMVMLDSDHHKKHVLKELRLYSQFVSPGSYLIVHDTSHNGHPLRTAYGEGPMEAVKDFLKENKNFVSDRSREKFLFTFLPQGFLKRTK